MSEVRGGRAVVDLLKAEGVRYDFPPYHQSVLHEVKPIYEVLPGWKTDITASTQYSQLPAAAKRYVKFLEQTTGVTG